MLHCGGTGDPIIVDISTTRHLGHGERICVSGEDDQGNLFVSSFLWKDKSPSPIVGALSTIPFKKSGLGILNPVTAAKEKFLSSQQAITELIQAATGGGTFSNTDHLLDIREERRHGKKNRHDVNKAKLKELVADLDSTDRYLILRAKDTGIWLKV